MMTRLEALYDDIESADIMCFATSSRKNPAMTLRTHGDYSIAINERAFRTDAERLVALAHEKGHCDTGAVHSVFAPLITRAQCENRANKMATYTLMPFNELVAALEGGASSKYELSEHFGVTEEFMQFALEVYADDIRDEYVETHGDDDWWV